MDISHQLTTAFYYWCVRRVPYDLINVLGPFSVILQSWNLCKVEFIHISSVDNTKHNNITLIFWLLARIWTFRSVKYCWYYQFLKWELFSASSGCVPLMWPKSWSWWHSIEVACDEENEGKVPLSSFSCNPWKSNVPAYYDLLDQYDHGVILVQTNMVHNKIGVICVLGRSYRSNQKSWIWGYRKYDSGA